MKNPPFRPHSIFATLALACFGCAPGAGSNTPGDSTPIHHGTPLRIAYFGDSLAAETFSTVLSQLHVNATSQVGGATFPGLAICDFLEGRAAGLPLPSKFKSRVRDLEPELVILQFWGGALTDCIKQNELGTDAYFDQYSADALAAVDQIRAGASDAGLPKPKILWVLQGPDRAMPDRTRRLNAIYQNVAAIFGDRTSDAGHDVSFADDPYPNVAHDRYGWTQFLPCTDIERQSSLCTEPGAFGGLTRLHKDGDPVHFCLGSAVPGWSFLCDTESPGISRYGGHIAADANAWLGI